MPTKPLSIIISAVLLYSIRSTLAWSGPGHELIAAEAFRQLSPELKAQAYDVLKSHPDYAKWEKDYHPNPAVDLATYVFMRSSMWPDEIRRSGSPYDHPNWHFIDYPLRPPTFAFEADARPNDNVLYGIAQCEKTLSDTNAAPELRAADLSYLVHLIGDLHQPLHCESFFTDAYLNGDRGGNDIYVKPAQTGVRLHAIWDGLLGNSASARSQYNYAISIEFKFPKGSLPELKEHTTPKEWSLESRSLAIDYGYLHGKLQGSKSAENAPSLPPDYTKKAKAVAERQAALAGYRLADEIQTYLKCGKMVPLLPQNTNTVAQADIPKTISSEQANKYYEETVTVTGKVAQVTVRPNVAFINLDGTGTSAPFTAVVFPDNMNEFGDLKRFENHNVEITGTVTEYRGKPEIILESAGQIRVVDGQ